jgi:nucleotide-binding universal stress UspA family protein
MTCADMKAAEMQRTAFMALKGLPAALQMPEIVPGGVHEVLQFRIAELQPDLVVIGSNSGRDTTSLGNYARDLMRAPPTDMLVAKPG